VWVSAVKKMPPTATTFLLLLVLAALIAPLEQARVHQLNSLDENMGFGLPFAALGAGYALGGWRQWLGRQRHWGKVVATTAAVITVISMLIVGRVERVQFRGPGATVAARLVAAIRQSYRPNTFVLDDGATTMEQYYLPEIPATAWRSVSSQNLYVVLQMQQVTHLCEYSVIVLRTGQGSKEEAVVKMLSHSRRYSPILDTGPGSFRIRVWKLRQQIPGATNGGQVGKTPAPHQGRC